MSVTIATAVSRLRADMNISSLIWTQSYAGLCEMDAKTHIQHFSRLCEKSVPVHPLESNRTKTLEDSSLASHIAADRMVQDFLKKPT